MEVAVVVILLLRCNLSVQLQCGPQRRQSADRCLLWVCHLRPATIRISYILCLSLIPSGTPHPHYFRPCPLASLLVLLRQRTMPTPLLELVILTTVRKRILRRLRNRVVVEELSIRRRMVVGIHVHLIMLAMDAIIYTAKISLELRKELIRTTEILNLGAPLTGLSTPGDDINRPLISLSFLFNFVLSSWSQFSVFLRNFTIAVTVNLYGEVYRKPKQEPFFIISYLFLSSDLRLRFNIHDLQ